MCDAFLKKAQMKHGRTLSKTDRKIESYLTGGLVTRYCRIDSHSTHVMAATRAAITVVGMCVMRFKKRENNPRSDSVQNGLQN